MDSIMKISFVIVECNSIEDVSRCVSSISNVVSNTWDVKVIVSSNSHYSPEVKKDCVSRFGY